MTLIKDELATLRTLKRARRLIAKEENWCQVSLRTRYGRTTAFCAVGAVHETTDAWGPPLDELHRATPKPYTSIIRFNDAYGRRHDAVLGVYDRAIRTVERRIERMRARRQK